MRRPKKKRKTEKKMENKSIEKTMELLKKSYSPFHVVKNLKEELLGHGFTELDEKEPFALEKEKKYFVTRNGSSLIAFKIPSDLERVAFQVSAAHTDSPTYKVKPEPVSVYKNLVSLLTEPYGGMIHSTWFDRPLSLGGRVVVSKGNSLETKLLFIDQPLLQIPNLCIHFNRDINNGYKYNPAKDLVPILGTSEDGKFDFKAFLLKELGLPEEEYKVEGFDLFLVSLDEPRRVGLNGEFLSSPRLDDLSSTYTSLLGFVEGEGSKNISVYCAFDNEEVGSLTRQGAHSTFFKETISRIGKGLGLSEEEICSAVARSMLLSIDNAHANHPNYPEISDKANSVLLNGGIVLKSNANQSYTSDAFSSALVKKIAEKADVKVQPFTNRSDLRGGSTLGNLSNAEISFVSADIGCPQLAMHSANEFMGVYDVEAMEEFVRSFFSSTVLLTGERAEVL